MVKEDEFGQTCESGSTERDFVHVLNDDIESGRGKKTAEEQKNRVVESEITASADHLDPIECELFLAARPGTAQESHLVA